MTVVPATVLRDGQRVRVQLFGAGPERKVWLSECATTAAANFEGCGLQVAQQPFAVTDGAGNAAVTFQVQQIAAFKPYDTTDTARCDDECVLVAIHDGEFVSMPLRFGTGR
jgi:Neocarzinostatin family